jgi:Sulfotransferase family
MRTEEPWVDARLPLVTRSIERLFGGLERFGVWQLPLDPDQLVRRAETTCGYQFNDRSWFPALAGMFRAIKTEGRLNALGRMILTRDVLRLLTHRLRMEEDRRIYPEIAGEKIERPVFVIGLPRTGSTLLHNLLGLNTASFQAPLTWEVMFPSPPPAFADKESVQAARRDLALFKLMIPNFSRLHPLEAELPQECVAILSHAFLSDEFDMLFNIPSFADWLGRQDLTCGYRYHRDFLQHLQFGRPMRRMVLKAPSHMRYLDELLTVYPDARIIQTHRRVVEVLPSLASLSTTLQKTFTAGVKPEAVGTSVIREWEEILELFVNARKRVGDDRFIDVYYRDLVANPVEVLRQIHGALGEAFTPANKQTVESFLTASRAHRRDHRYALADFGMDAADVNRRFSFYGDRFGLAT